ncbi:MAG: hypothetical protein IMW86_03605 [Hydrogenibacillus sp.]|nr:hypothetical protein [Hydrogenibacillus sp.]
MQNSQTVEYRSGSKSVDIYELTSDGERFGAITWVEWSFQNGDRGMLMRFTPSESGSYTVTLPIFLASPYTMRHVVYPDGADLTRSRFSDPERLDVQQALPLAAVWLDRADAPTGIPSIAPDLPRPPERRTSTDQPVRNPASAFLSAVEVYALRDNGVLEERRDLSPALAPTEKGLTFTLPVHSGQLVEWWGLFSEAPLIDWDKADPETVELVRVADFDRARKWTLDGPRYITPEGYSPSCPRCFYVNPAQHVGEKWIHVNTGGRLFADFALMALDNAVTTQNDAGYWPITTRSEWLKRDYGIDAGYYDTRWSTDAALFLLAGFKAFGDDVFLQAARRYADFLVDFAARHHFATPSGGTLVYDYGHPDAPQAKTHTSLNHLLTEMNFLYRIAERTGEPRYRAAAERMLKAIEDTVDGWPNADGDLHYAYLVDGQFGLQDYPLLTLKDLRLAQSVLASVHGAPNAAIQKLIDVKTAYLKAHHLPLY